MKARTKTTRTPFTTFRQAGALGQEAMHRGAPQVWIGANADGTYHMSVEGDPRTYQTAEAFRAVYGKR